LSRLWFNGSVPEPRAYRSISVSEKVYRKEG
jgi:hypothetical protein